MRICNFKDCLDVFGDIAIKRGFEFNNVNSNIISISLADSKAEDIIWNENVRIPSDDTYDLSVHEFLSKLRYMLEDFKNSVCPYEVKDRFSKLIKITESKIINKVKKQNELAIAIQNEKKKLNSKMSLNESIARDRYIDYLIEEFIDSSPKHIRVLLEKEFPKIRDYFNDIYAVINIAKKNIERDCIKIFKDQHECEGYSIIFSDPLFKNNKITTSCVITLENWFSTDKGTLTILERRVKACFNKCERVFFDSPYTCDLKTPNDIDFKRWGVSKIIDWDGRIVIDIHLTAEELAEFRGVPLSEVL